jgi:hypothetical protein
MVSCAVHISLSVYKKYRQLQQRDEYALSAVVWPILMDPELADW